MSTDSGKLTEVIYPLLVFRNDAAFRIPKEIRERGYIQSLDLQVSSVDWNIYENGKALPPIQFYGYVQLVMQDACTIEVPIKFPRQRVWHIRIEDALSQWRDIHTWHNGALEWNEWFFNFFTQGQDPPIPLPPIEYPDTNFVESPLREVFVKVKENCQFEIELTQWEPVPFTGRNAKTYDGKSRQVDGDKDGGLPVDGIQPRRNSSDDPWAGNRNPSLPTPENGFFTPTDKLFDTVPEYVPLSPPFEGGQCANINYQVAYQVFRVFPNGTSELADGSSFVNGQWNFYLPNVIGKIIGTEVVRNVQGNFDVFIITQTQRIGIVGNLNGDNGVNVEAAIVDVRRSDGLDDDCGSQEVDDPTQL